MNTSNIASSSPAHGTPGARQRTRTFNVVAGALLLAACGADADYEPRVDSEMVDGEEVLYSPSELGTSEQALSAACGGDDSNALAAALAVAIGNELGR